MGQHYLPQYYLRGFEEDGRIWAHDRLECRSFPTRVRSVAHENGLYSDELETWLNTKVEQPAQSALQKLRTRQTLTADERLALAKYMVVMWKRVPEGRSLVLRRLPEVINEVHANLSTQLDTFALQEPDAADQVETWRRKIAEVIAKQRSDPAPEIWHRTIQSQSGPHVVDAILSMQWNCLYANHAQFLTSDNPVFFFASEGVGRSTSELSFPLSSSVVLWASRATSLSGECLRASPTAIREINRRTAYNSARFVYSQRNEPWILPFATKGHWQLARLRL